jgi:RNA polymerase sigma factor (sigma-70 family)
MMIAPLQPTDRAAFVREFVACLRPLLNFVRRRLRYHEALGELAPGELRAEDVVDAVLLEAVHSGERPAGVSTYPWLRRLARRVLGREIERARRHRRELSLERPLHPGPAAASEGDLPPLRLVDILPDPSAPIPDQVLEQAEFQRALARLLGQVPDSWREPFLLHTADGYGLRAIAELEGVSVPEVRRRIEQARRFLRARLAEEYEEASGPPPAETLFAAVERGELPAEHQVRLIDRLTAAAAPEGARP